MQHINVVANITGKIWKIEVQPGQFIGMDETLLIVESMKMEIPVTATRAGKILELCVVEEEAVHEGQIVAIIETET